jgi:hypothetical protein
MSASPNYGGLGWKNPGMAFLGLAMVLLRMRKQDINTRGKITPKSAANFHEFGRRHAFIDVRIYKKSCRRKKVGLLSFLPTNMVSKWKHPRSECDEIGLHLVSSAYSKRRARLNSVPFRQQYRLCGYIGT